MTAAGASTRITRDLLGYTEAHVPASPGTFYRTNLPRVAGENLAALTTQVMTSVLVYLQAGDVVTNISFTSGATAAGTPTNYFFALYSNASTPALLGQTADQTSTAWAANTVKTLALASAVTIPATGFYWASCMVKATTVPTLRGGNCNPVVVTGERVLAQTSGSSLTDTAPATITSGTTILTVPRVVIT